METLNIGIRSFVNLQRRIKAELIHSQSASQQKLIEADLGRIRSYQVAQKKMLEVYFSMKVLDLPKSSPGVLPLGDLPSYPTVENGAINDIVSIYQKAEIELVESQSSRLSTSFHEADYDRQVSYLEAVDYLIDQYMVPIKPEDFVETSFQTPVQPNIEGVGVATMASR